MKIFVALGLVSLVALTSGCIPRQNADVPFKNVNPYRIKAERVVTRTVNRQQPPARQAQQPGDVSVSKPIYFSERTGHILVPTQVNGERIFQRSNEVLEIGRTYYNVVSGQRLQVSRSATGTFQLKPIGGQYIDPSKVPYAAPPAIQGRIMDSTSMNMNSEAGNLILGDSKGSLGYNNDISDSQAVDMVRGACQDRGMRARYANPININATSKVLNFTCQ